ILFHIYHQRLIEPPPPEAPPPQLPMEILGGNIGVMFYDVTTLYSYLSSFIHVACYTTLKKKISVTFRCF
ncbi:hypothetical protein, partial [Parabacteroides sp. MSK.9.14]|uniref:hypothetical protein n=1 Tax=Parabacteroides sp. MSK.9.14 TaxID=2849180 RepID=UPI001C24AE87